MGCRGQGREAPAEREEQLAAASPRGGLEGEIQIPYRQGIMLCHWRFPRGFGARGHPPHPKGAIGNDSGTARPAPRRSGRDPWGRALGKNSSASVWEMPSSQALRRARPRAARCGP